MKTLNLSASSDKMSIAVLLEAKLKDQDNVFAMALRIGLKRGWNDKVFEMLRSQANDNYKLVSEIVGQDLLNRIINL